MYNTFRTLLAGTAGAYRIQNAKNPKEVFDTTRGASLLPRLSLSIIFSMKVFFSHCPTPERSVGILEDALCGGKARYVKFVVFNNYEDPKTCLEISSAVGSTVSSLQRLLLTSLSSMLKY